LEILVNEAALNAARTSKEEVGKEDFEFAKDKVMMGAERRSLLLTDKDKEITAFHESGHALVAKFLKNTDPVHKLTIVPRGMALGLMQQLPEHDKHTYSRSYFLDTLAVLYGGRVAEELVFNELNTGASSDIKRATEIARSMVAEWGMSDLVGPIHYLDKEEHVFLGKEFGTAKHHSGTQQAVIDKEVKRLIDEAYGTARKILSDNSHLLHKVARRLLEVETIDGEELERLIKGDGDNAPVAP
jgi:cell division protease FtsH